MAIGAVATGVSLHSKLKVALAASKTVGAMKAAGTIAAKGAGTAAKTTAGSVSRFAGPKLAATGNRIASQVQGLTMKEKVALFGPDVLGGVAAAAFTPGDLGDKAIVGLGSAAGGAAGSPLSIALPISTNTFWSLTQLFSSR